MCGREKGGINMQGRPFKSQGGPCRVLVFSLRKPVGTLTAGFEHDVRNV